LTREISLEEYRGQKAGIDRELDRLREVYSAMKAQITQMQMDEKAKSARTELAREITGASGLTMEHPSLSDFSKAVEDQKVDVLLLTKLSRLGHDIWVVAQYWYMLREHSVRVFTAVGDEVSMGLITCFLNSTFEGAFAAVKILRRRPFQSHNKHLRAKRYTQPRSAHDFPQYQRHRTTIWTRRRSPENAG